MCLLLYLLSFLIIIFSPAFSSLANGAKPVLNPVNGHYYQLVESTSGLNWYNAKAAAETMEHNRMPGYLATITTSQEHDFVVSIFPKILPENVWLGASDEANEGRWIWITAESDTWFLRNDANWDLGEPNGGTSENCLDFGDGSLKLNDESCDRSLNFYLVEYSAPILHTFDGGENCGSGISSQDLDVYGIIVRFQTLLMDESMPRDCAYSWVDQTLFGDTIITPSEPPRYFMVSRATHPNFDDFIDALTDGKHCVYINDAVVDTAGNVNEEVECGGEVWSAPDLKGAQVGSIELRVSNVKFEIDWNEGCPCWVFWHTGGYHVTLYEELPKLTVEIDIKPHSFPNSINLKSKGKVPVAILTSNNFNAYNVNPDTVNFAGTNPLSWTMEDTDNDGDHDMLLHFKTQELDLTKDSTEAILEGTTYDGVQITGTDSVKIVPKGKGYGKKDKKG